VATSGISLKPNKWYFLVGTYDGKSVKIYVDSVEEASTPHADGIAGNGAFRINNLEQFPGIGQSWFFGGLIDEVRVYARALQSIHIQQLYAEDLKSRNYTKR